MRPTGRGFFLNKLQVNNTAKRNLNFNLHHCVRSFAQARPMCACQAYRNLSIDTELGKKTYHDMLTLSLTF